MNRKQFLEKAIAATCGDRNASYGPPFINMQCAAELKAIYDKYSWDAGTAHRNAIHLALDKISRIACGGQKFHVDNYVDFPAYGAIAGECHPDNLSLEEQGLLADFVVEFGNTVQTAPGDVGSAGLDLGMVGADAPTSPMTDHAAGGNAQPAPVNTPAVVNPSDPTPTRTGEPDILPATGLSSGLVSCSECVFGQAVRKDGTCQANLKASGDLKAQRTCFKFRPLVSDMM